MAFVLLGILSDVTMCRAQNMSDCYSATNYFSKKITKLFYHSLPDSIENYIIEWDQSCESKEELTRLKFLWAIKTNTFNENIYDQFVISHLIEYREKVRIEQDLDHLTAYQKAFKKYTYSNHQFNQFTQSLAANLHDNISPDNRIQHMVATFYNNEFDSFFVELKRPENRDSQLYSYYQYYLEDLRNSYEQFITVGAGYWIPADSYSLFGQHPFAGFTFGFKTDKNTFQVTTNFRFKKGDLFYTLQGSEFVESHYMRSIMLALEQRRDIHQLKNYAINAGFGFGMEHFVIRLQSPNASDDTQSFFINLGFGFRYYWAQNHSNFSDIQFVFNRYKSSFSNADYSFSARLSFGLNLNKRKNELMKLLAY